MDKHSKLPQCATSFVVQIVAIISFLAISVSGATSAELSVTTRIYCSDPDVPALFLATKLSLSTSIFEKAIREGICKYNPEPLTVMPLRFIQSTAADSAAVEPYGYIWAVRLVDGTVGYWYFWKAEHEAMLIRMPGI